jgi:bifunctional UDP-N-acetylglucosamine pyrophosphorylase/glucosamine-1-phosphate N-acetyltransferase
MSSMRMGTADIAAVILAAGMGTRMKSGRPKVLHAVAGRPMIHHVLAAIEPLGAARTAVVVGPGMDDVATAVAPVGAAVQKDRLGTADAVKAARGALDGFTQGTVLILYGDTPLIRTGTLRRMLDARAAGAAVVVLGFRPDDPTGYGRLIVDDSGQLEAIVEDREATDAQRAIDLCNSAVMAVDAAHLYPLIDRIGNDNAKGEYYLTDIVGLARGAALDCAVIEAGADELMGVDSRTDLARAEAVWQQLRRAEAMAEGATLIDPGSVWFSFDTKLGRDVVIGPHVFFGPGVTVGDGVEIRPYSHIEGATIGAGAIIGPFARLRPGAVLDEDVHVGNFVEVKNAVLGEGVKANHLTYIGDAEIGAGTNVGAGTITCNYDGYNKHRTVIGKSVFIGSNTAIVAPVKIGDGAIVGAGSTVVRNVAAGSLTIARGEQTDLPDRADPLRERLIAEKKAKTKDKD